MPTDWCVSLNLVHRTTKERNLLNRIKTMLVALVAVFAIGGVMAAGASAHAANHGKISVVKPAILGGNASCEFTFTKSNWSPTAGTPPSWSTNITGVTKDPLNCDVTSISTTGLTLTKYAGSPGTWDMTGGLTLVTHVVIIPGIWEEDIECTYDLDNVHGTWTLHTGPPDWKEFVADNDSTASLVSGSDLCPDPADIVSDPNEDAPNDTWIHTDTN